MKRGLCVCAAGSRLQRAFTRVTFSCLQRLFCWLEGGAGGSSARVRSALILLLHRGPHENAVVRSVWGPAWGCLPSVRVGDRVTKTGLMPWAPRAGGPGHAPHWPQLWRCYFPGSRALQGVRPPRPLVILEVFRNLFVFFSKPTGCILQWFWNVSLDWIF